jgi:hypothetical protein
MVRPRVESRVNPIPNHSHSPDPTTTLTLYSWNWKLFWRTVRQFAANSARTRANSACVRQCSLYIVGEMSANEGGVRRTRSFADYTALTYDKRNLTSHRFKSVFLTILTATGRSTALSVYRLVERAWFNQSKLSRLFHFAMFIYHGAGKRDRRILLLPNWQRKANAAELASIVIRIYHDFRKFPILGP